MQTKEKPILFSTPMVQAILAGRKTMTRRIVKPQPDESCWFPGDALLAWSSGVQVEQVDGKQLVVKRCPYGEPRKRLWVRETWRPWWDEDPPAGTGKWCCIQYKDGAIYKPGTNPNIPDIPDENTGHGFAGECDEAPNVKWRPSIHMPRWASRITLEITSVRVERLQEISGDDCVDEGIEPQGVGSDMAMVAAFRDLWDSINGKGSWKANPWVWVLSFKRLESEAACREAV